MENAKLEVKIFYPVGPEMIHGISDYCQCLVKALQLQNVNAQFCNFQRTLRGLFLPRKLRWKTSKAPRIVHLQWPYRLEHKRLDYYCSCIEALLLLLRGKIQRASVIVTFHESSWRKRPLDFILLILLADHVVFTTGRILNTVKQSLPLLGRYVERRSTVIPIGSNVPAVHVPSNDSWDILYFGIIRRNKGLDDVLALARTLHESGPNPNGNPWRVRIIGGIDTEPKVWQWLLSEVYDLSDAEMEQALGLRTEFMELNAYLAGRKTKWPVTCSFNLPPEDVSKEIGRHRIAYYPYPEEQGGINEQRGAPLAVMEHGVVVISSEGKTTPDGMKQDVVSFAKTPAQAVESIRHFVHDKAAWEAYSRASREYAVSRWVAIASSHIALYCQASAGSFPL